MGKLSQIEIVVHIDDVLAHEQRDGLIRDLKKRAGVEQARFTPGREHLLIVDYDQDQLAAMDVLTFIRQDHIGAELVGPM